MNRRPTEAAAAAKMRVKRITSEGSLSRTQSPGGVEVKRMKRKQPETEARSVADVSMCSDDLLISNIPDNVVKVYCTHCEPNYSQPWTTKRQTSSTSTGFVTSISVKGTPTKVLLTNAHSVDHSAVVQVRKRGDHQKFEAKVLCVGHDCDLALLSVDDKDFWKGLVPLEWGEPPRLEDPVTVVGYPVGGDNTSVTQGIVSRIDLQPYSNGSSKLLAIQIDAAINPGNSGGPALNRNKELVGIAFQALKDGETENIGYIIPCEVVQHFLKDYEKTGKYRGFGDGGFSHQKLENKYMRDAFKLTEKHVGVLVKKVESASPAVGLLEKGDIVLSVDGIEIASDGTVPFKNGERIPFCWLMSSKFVDETVELVISRKGERKTVSLPLQRLQLLVPTHIDETPDGALNESKSLTQEQQDLPTSQQATARTRGGKTVGNKKAVEHKEKSKSKEEVVLAEAQQSRKPQYLIVGGLVFVPLTEPYIKSEYGEEFDFRAPVRLLDKWLHGLPKEIDEQVVVLSHVLAHETTVGFQAYSNILLNKFNGVDVKNLKHLANMVESCTDKYLRFELDHDEIVVLDLEATKAAQATILDRNMIPSNKHV